MPDHVTAIQKSVVFSFEPKTPDATAGEEPVTATIGAVESTTKNAVFPALPFCFGTPAATVNQHNRRAFPQILSNLTMQCDSRGSAGRPPVQSETHSVPHHVNAGMRLSGCLVPRRWFG